MCPDIAWTISFESQKHLYLDLVSWCVSLDRVLRKRVSKTIFRIKITGFRSSKFDCPDILIVDLKNNRFSLFFFFFFTVVLFRPKLDVLICYYRQSNIEEFGSA